MSATTEIRMTSDLRRRNPSMATLLLRSSPQFVLREGDARDEIREELEREHRQLIRHLMTMHEQLELEVSAPAPSDLEHVSPSNRVRSTFSYRVTCHPGEYAALEDYIRSLKFSEFELKVTQPADVVSSSMPVTLARGLNLVHVGNPASIGDDLALLHPTHLLFDPDYLPSGATDDLLSAARNLPSTIGYATSSGKAALAIWVAQLLSQYLSIGNDSVRGGLRQFLDYGTKAYYAAMPRPLRILRRDARWQHVLRTLRTYGGSVMLTCRRRKPSSLDLQLASKTLEAVHSTYLAPAKVSQDEFDVMCAVQRAMLAQQPIFEAHIAVRGAASRLLALSVGRDLDDECFEPTDSTLEQKLAAAEVAHGASFVEAVRRLQSIWTQDEIARLVEPPHTFGDALAGIRHHVVKPFTMPFLTSEPTEPAVLVGRCRDGTEVWVTLAALNRHTLIAGAAGSGKTTSIRRIVRGVTVDHGLNWLVIDPTKTDFRSLLSLPGAALIELGGNDRFAFNPFMCPDTVRVYDHAEKVARALGLLFPSTRVGAAFLLEMVRNTYLEAYRNGLRSGQKDVRSEPAKVTLSDLEWLRGVHLRLKPQFLPTFQDFLKYGLTYLEHLQAIGNGEWIRDTLAFFRIRLEILKFSAVARIFSPRDRRLTANHLFTGRHVLETGRLAEDEANALSALLVMLLHEHRQDKKEIERAAGEQSPLDFLLVIDEAHRLVPEYTQQDSATIIPGPGEEVSRQLCKFIAEIRSYGVGVIIGEQSPSKVAHDVLVNTSCKFVHTIVDGRDKQTIATALSLAPDEQQQLSFLDCGEAVVSLPSVARPVLARILNEGDFVDARSADAAGRSVQGDRRTLVVVDASAEAAAHRSMVEAVLAHLCDRLPPDASKLVVLPTSQALSPKASKRMEAHGAWTGPLLLRPTLEMLKTDVERPRTSGVTVLLVLASEPADAFHDAACNLKRALEERRHHAVAVALSDGVSDQTLTSLGHVGVRVRDSGGLALPEIVGWLLGTMQTLETHANRGRRARVALQAIPAGAQLVR